MPGSLAPMIENLPAKLSELDRAQLENARDRRDERMSILFRCWPALSETEMAELRKLSDERQRLARHSGILRRLHALRASSRSPGVAGAIVSLSAGRSAAR